MSKSTYEANRFEDGPKEAPWQGVVFVCSKCMKRQDRELRDEIRHAVRKRGERALRVVPCGCLDVCPDDGITIAIGTELAAVPARVRVIGRKQPVDALIDVLVDGLGHANPART